MLNFINIYSFIPVSGCVGMSPSALLCPGALALSQSVGKLFLTFFL
jgi:hypothetical protein